MLDIAHTKRKGNIQKTILSFSNCWLPFWPVFGGSLFSASTDAFFPLSPHCVCKPPNGLISSDEHFFDTLPKWTLCCNHTGQSGNCEYLDDFFKGIIFFLLF